MTSETKEKQSRDCWSEDGQVFFTDGYGYGLTKDLRTICLGQEEDIKKFFETGEMAKELNPLQRQVLASIAEYRKEEGIGIRETADIGTGGLQRTGDDGTLRRNTKTARLLKEREGLSFRQTRRCKSISGKRG